MELIEVINSSHEKEFIDVPVRLYKNDPYWIRPLDKDLKSVFDPSLNKIAKPGSFRRWILKDDRKNLIGRIAAFINEKTAFKNKDYSVGGIGFFECIKEEEAATLLFDNAKTWLKERGVEAMEGPINFGDRDKFWGLLSEGFDKEPNYLANYNPPYYKDFFENYGFKCYFNQYTFSLSKKSPFSPEYIARAESVVSQPEYKFNHIQLKKLDKFTEDFKQIYNEAWARHLGVSEMTIQKARAIINSIKPVIDEKTAWFGYHHDKPIAFFIMIPEVNQVFKHVNGKLDLVGKLIFLYHKVFRTNTKLLGLIFGVIPEFDGKGVTNAITYVARNALQNYKNYQSLEMHGIGDFNPAMIKFVHKLGKVQQTKTHTTYRYLFDRTKEFERMPLKENRTAKNSRNHLK
jgi:hypothetical protein